MYWDIHRPVRVVAGKRNGRVDPKGPLLWDAVAVSTERNKNGFREAWG